MRIQQFHPTHRTFFQNQTTAAKRLPGDISYEHAQSLAPWIVVTNPRSRQRPLTPDQVIAKKLGELLQERKRLTEPQLQLVEAHLRNIETLPHDLKKLLFETSDLEALYTDPKNISVFAIQNYLQNISVFAIQNYLQGLSTNQTSTELQQQIAKLLQKHLNEPKGIPPYFLKLIFAGLPIEEMFERNTIRTCNTQGQCITAQISETPRLSSRAADVIWPWTARTGNNIPTAQTLRGGSPLHEE